MKNFMKIGYAHLRLRVFIKNVLNVVILSLKTIVCIDLIRFTMNILVGVKSAKKNLIGKINNFDIFFPYSVGTSQIIFYWSDGNCITA